MKIKMGVQIAGITLGLLFGGFILAPTAADLLRYEGPFTNSDCYDYREFYRAVWYARQNGAAREEIIAEIAKREKVGTQHEDVVSSAFGFEMKPYYRDGDTGEQMADSFYRSCERNFPNKKW